MGNRTNIATLRDTLGHTSAPCVSLTAHTRIVLGGSLHGLLGSSGSEVPSRQRRSPPVTARTKTVNGRSPIRFPARPRPEKLSTQK